MKGLVKRAKSLMLFDLALQTAYISMQFGKTQKKLQTEIPGWSTTATRQTLISNYWFIHVAGHFALMFGLPASVFFMWHLIAQSNFYLPGVLIAGLLSYPILYLFHYRPYFSSIFLPRLETVKEAFDKKQTEQLQRCRQAQLSNFALVLVFYVLDKTSGMNALQCNDQFAGLLTALYGVDKGSLKKSLELIIGNRKNLPTRKATEIRTRFSEAIDFLEKMKFPEGVQILQDLEMRFAKQSVNGHSAT